ncbi:MAG: hypothetical protein WAO20_04035 [Acidobacteriota bacterium]
MTRRFLPAMTLAIAFSVCSLAAPRPESDVAVIVHPGVGESDLALGEIRRLLLGDRQFWPSGQRVTLMIRAPVARERDVVLKKIYQMSEPQFRQYWIAKVFRAEAVEGPKIVYSNEMATQLVQAIPGSISFVSAENVPPGVKVLRVDGKLPGDPGYPLR